MLIDVALIELEANYGIKSPKEQDERRESASVNAPGIVQREEAGVAGDGAGFIQASGALSDARHGRHGSKLPV